MLKCIAIDDEPLALRQLSTYISKVPYLELVASTTNPLEAQRLLTEQAIDLLFVDINMPDLNGLDLVRTLIRRPMVIFTTAYAEYAVEGFRLDAIDYLLKPFSFADFSRAVAKAYAIFELRELAARTHRSEEPAAQQAVVEPTTAVEEAPTAERDEAVLSEAEPADKEYISVKADYKVSLIRIADIVFIESEGEYVRIHLADGSKITTLFRIKNMEASLPAESFMRIHRCYIVNLHRIKSYVRGRVYLSDKEYLPIGENYKEAFKGYIERAYKNLRG